MMCCDEDEKSEEKRRPCTSSASASFDARDADVFLLSYARRGEEQRERLKVEVPARPQDNIFVF